MYPIDTDNDSSFTLERQVTHWDTDFLSRLIRDIVLFTKYKGTVDVTFLIIHSKIIILKDDSTPSTTRQRSFRPQKMQMARLTKTRGNKCANVNGHYLLLFRSSRLQLSPRHLALRIHPSTRISHSPC
jgi:hypothetical protein